jgi:hypothetical protein
VKLRNMRLHSVWVGGESQDVLIVGVP